MSQELLDSGIIGALTVVVAITYLHFVNRQLMNTERGYSEHLQVSIFYRAFVIVFALGGVLGFGAIVHSTSDRMLLEQLFAWTLAFGFSVLISYFVYFGFLVKASVTDKVVKTQSPLRTNQVDLKKLTSFKINKEFNTFELRDGKSVVRFCHYIEGKRALIKLLLQYAPVEFGEDLTDLL